MSEPTRRDMTRSAWSLAVLAVVLGLVAGCGGGGSASLEAGGEPIDLERLAQVASSSADARSGRFAFALEVAMPGSDETFSFSGEGAFDVASGRASFSVDLSSFAALLGGFFARLGGSDAPDLGDPDGWKIEAIQDGSVTYLRFPALDEQLPAGKTWIRSEEGHDGTAGSFAFGDLGELAETDPRDLLELLRKVSGEIETVGVEALRGTETTHYRATFDASSVAPSGSDREAQDGPALTDQLLSQPGLDEIPVDIWIDGEGLVRKLALDASATQPGASEPSRAVLSFELWDLGEPVEIGLPPTSEVVDESRLER